LGALRSAAAALPRGPFCGARFAGLP
jgi:hypothetical protein